MKTKSNECPHCGKQVIGCYGNLESPSVILLDYSIQYLDFAKKALEAELGRAGIQMSQCKIVTYWKHAKDDECQEGWHTQKTLADLIGSKEILMLGTDCCVAYLGYPGSEISGTIQKSKFIPGASIVPASNVIGMAKGPIGEYRIALKKFADLRRRKKK